MTADNGIVGYGDWRCQIPDKSTVEHLVDRDPFDFLRANLNMGLSGALYDLVGKYLEIPAYKLTGQKVRDGVSVAAWTRPKPADMFADEVTRAVGEGYMVMKMHTNPSFDVHAQTRAVEEVAPPGFKLHYDFNGRGTVGGTLSMIKELEKSPVVGYAEDPLDRNDLDGWRTLRQRTRVPLVMHVPPLGGLHEVLLGCCDAFMVGERGMGNALSRGAAYGLTNTQVIVQLTGGTLTKALALHIAAVLPTASGHSINLDDQYGEDIVTQRIAVDSGISRVPEEPGLGVEVDEEALARVAANRPTVVLPKHLGVTSLSLGRTLYTPNFPDLLRITGTEESLIANTNFRFWEDDGSEEFVQAYERVEREGYFIE